MRFAIRRAHSHTALRRRSTFKVTTWLRRWLAVVLVAGIWGLGILSVRCDDAKGAPLATRLEVNTLEQVFKVDGDLYSGSSPTDDAAFQALAKLGVKTLISVDGAKPSVELA